MRRTFISASTGLVLASALLLSGCSKSSSADQQPVDSTAKAVIDKVSGTIRLPLDRYGMNHSEQATIDLGYQLATRDCMKKDGFDYQVVDARADPTPVDRRYGVWVENEAAQNGYETPADTPSQVKLQQLNSAANPEGWDAAHLRCGQEAAKTYIANSLPSDLSAFQGYEDFMTLPQTKKVLDDWRQCLSDQNVNPPRDGWVPSSAMSGGKENEIKIALIDVKCKEEHGTVQKLADIEASLQMPKVRADEPQLVDQRKAVDDALKAANEIIAANGL